MSLLLLNDMRALALASEAVELGLDDLLSMLAGLSSVVLVSVTLDSTLVFRISR